MCCVCNKTWFFSWKYSFCHNIRKVHSSKGKYSVFFATLMFYIQFLLLPSMYCSYSKYFVNCLWTFAFVPTRKSNAAKFIARKELEWRCFYCWKGLVLKKTLECFEGRNNRYCLTKAVWESGVSMPDLMEKQCMLVQSLQHRTECP